MIPPTASTVAVAARMAERRVIERLRALGAVSRESAKPVSGLSPLESRRLAHLVRLGVAGEVSPGVYYLDLEALETREVVRARVRVFAFTLLVIVLIALGLVLFTHAF
jgi:hypothetical protein